MEGLRSRTWLAIFGVIAAIMLADEFLTFVQPLPSTDGSLGIVFPFLVVVVTHPLLSRNAVQSSAANRWFKCIFSSP